MKIIKKKIVFIVFIKTEKDYNRVYYYSENAQKYIAEKMGHDPEFMVQRDGSGCYVASEYFSNDEIFSILGMDVKNKYEFQETVLGYNSYFGNFPYCKTLEDAVALLNEALKLLING